MGVLEIFPFEEDEFLAKEEIKILLAEGIFDA